MTARAKVAVAGIIIEIEDDQATGEALTELALRAAATAHSIAPNHTEGAALGFGGTIRDQPTYGYGIRLNQPRTRQHHQDGAR